MPVAAVGGFEVEFDVRPGGLGGVEPLGLADALSKISAYAGRIVMPSAERNPTSAPLFIVNPLSGQRMDNLFSTHPNVENRIRALEAMAGDGGRPVATRPSPIPTVRRR